MEMALCASILFLVILGIMECSLAVYTEHYVEAAAASAVRYATVRGATYAGTSCASATSSFCNATQDNIKTYLVANADPGITSSKLTVTASWLGGSGGTGTCVGVQGSQSPGCLVTVTVTYPFTFKLPKPLNKAITFSATRSGVISQ